MIDKARLEQKCSMWNIRNRKKTTAKTRREAKEFEKSNGGSKICECGAVFA